MDFLKSYRRSAASGEKVRKGRGQQLLIGWELANHSEPGSGRFTVFLSGFGAFLTSLFTFAQQ